MADDAGTQGGDTPPANNVSDGTTQAQGGTPVTSRNDNFVSTPANTQRNDTPGNTVDHGALTRLLDRIESLPESIVNAMKEAAPVAPPQNQTPDNSATQTGTHGQDGATGNSTVTADDSSAVAPSRSERFAAWWFGK